ncbi:MAG TPA: ATP-binding protein [Rubrobacteraceae bacterium]|nr:ATP-binding protein [Rubrobacteraceae bacterium]
MVVLTMLTAVLLVAPFVLGSVTGGAGEAVGSLVQALGQTLLFSLLVAGLVATATAAVASLFVSRRVVGSLLYVLDATRRIAAGGYGERVPVAETDEIGELSESFNAMAKALQETERRRVEVISDVSHELRTPLSTLRGYLESVMSGTIEPSEETFSLLYGETTRMERLVNDLGQLSRAEAGQLVLNVVPFSAAETVRAATEGMRPLFEEKGIELKATTASDPPPVLADADRVAQVLTNLLDNALRHTPAGGLVAVEAASGTRGVTFRVTDTGEGISAEHLGRVFERFYRAEKSRSRAGSFGGSGVGLSISRALAEAMGSRIRAESAGLGCGATFYFTLPASERRSMSGS